VIFAKKVVFLRISALILTLSTVLLLRNQRSNFCNIANQAHDKTCPIQKSMKTIKKFHIYG